MELIQSFIYSISRVKLSLYEQRILLKVVEYSQSRLKGLTIARNLEQWQHDFDNVKMIIPIKDILTDGSQHYNQVHLAALQLMNRNFEYQDPRKGDWFATPIVYNVSHDARSGVLEFYVARKLFDVILDFTKGFRQYSLETALSIPSPYASRLYSLMCGQVSPLRFEIPELKKMFGVEDKYAQTADFIKKVIVPSQKILDDQGVTSFTFSRVKAGTKVVALMFFPVKRDSKSKNQLAAQASTSMFMSKNMSVLLMHYANFTLRELGAHKVLLLEFSKLPECTIRLQDIIHRMITRNKNKGYVISAMRSELEEFRAKNSMSK